MSSSDSDRPAADLRHTLDHESVVFCVRFSPDGERLASGSHRAVRVYDVASGECAFTLASALEAPASQEEAEHYVRAVVFSPDSTTLAATMPHNTIRVWDLATREETHTLTGHEADVSSLDSVGDLVASGSWDRTVRLWDARSGQCKKMFSSSSSDGPSDDVTSVALSPDGRFVAAGSHDRVVRVWDTESSTLVDQFHAHRNAVFSIAFSPDGRQLVSGSLDNAVMLWDVNAQGRKAMRPRVVFKGHTDLVLSVAYSPDGRWIMSGSKDRSFQFWDPRNASRSVLSLTWHRNSVLSIASSPTAPHTFATSGGDYRAFVWSYASHASS